MRSGVFSPNGSEARQTELLLRVGLYLVERDYFKTGQIPELFRWLAEDENRAILRVVRRIFADKMGIESDELSFLEDEEYLGKSGETYLKSTPEYGELLKEWEAANKDDPELAKPEPGDVMEKITEPLTDWFVLFQTHDAVKVTLSLPAPPLRSNGQWDAGKVVWGGKLEQGNKPAISAPVLYCASWVTPNDEVQRRYFGETILTGETLLGVCLGHAALTAGERSELALGLEKLPPVAEWKPQFDALREQLDAEFVKRGSPIPKGEFSSRAWRLVLSHLPEPFGGAK